MAQVTTNNMKSVLMSIKPPYAQMILEGSKTIELRRRFTQDLEPDTKLLIYSTDPVKKIIGECRIKAVLKLSIADLWAASCRDAMISWETYQAYFTGVTEGYGVVLHKQIAYEKPIPLEEMRSRYNLNPPQSYRTVDIGL